MRGRRDPQAAILAFVDLEERVPKDHPIRTIKPGVSILGVLMLKGQPNRDSGMIFRLKTSRLPGALSLLARSSLHSPSAWRRR